MIRSAAALMLAFALAAPAPAAAQEPEPAGEATPLYEESMDGLYALLQGAEEPESARIAEEIAERWRDSGSASIDLLYERGHTAMSAGDFPKAIAHFSRMIAFQPDFAEGWNARATAHFAQREIGRALADLYEALRLEPRHFQAMVGLGIILEGLDLDARALEVYERALELHPHLGPAREGVDRLENAVRGDPI